MLCLWPLFLYMYLQHPLLTGFRSWPDQCEISRYEVFPGSPQGCEHQSYSRMPSFPQRLRTSNSFKRCLIVVWNFRPHVVWAKRLAKLKRLTDFISKYFWAKIEELGISDRLSVIFPKKGRYRNQIFAFKDTDRLPVSLYSPNVLKKVLQFHIVFQPSPTSQNDRDDSW